MKMVLNGRTLTVLVVVSLWLLLSCGLSYGVQTDIDCLKGIKAELEDPYGYLNTSWNFNNNTEGFICKFTGIECWHPDENKVLNIRLSDMGLKGQFPAAIQNCTSLTGLDLSSNKLFGNIPKNISQIIQFVTTLDLSSNNFSGEIPVSLANCTYLNVLKLDHNRLTGLIPAQFALLARIKQFSVANNLLTGPVPYFGPNTSISADSYANNPGLCGPPLDACPSPSKKSHTTVIAAAAVGGVTVAAIGVGIGMFFFLRRVSVKKKEEDPEGNKWAKSLKGVKGIKVSMFEKSVSKMKFNDLMKATGLPLALEVLGSLLRGRDISDWQYELMQLEEIQTEGIQKILKQSFELLEQNEKDVFLDIACFFKGWDKAYVVNMLKACGLYPDSAITKLINRSLITVDQFGKLWMHDLIQKMGREIVRQESPINPGHRSRLWRFEDAFNVLTENTGTDEIRGLMLCWPEPEPRMMQLDAKTFKKMKNLKFLIVRNVHILRGLEYLPNGLRLLDWPDYSSPLPSTFCPQSLVELNMPYSRITLDEPFRKGIWLVNLKYIKCGSCESIMEFPALCTPNLEVLDLSKCKNLIVVDELVGSLDKLEIWILKGCEKLQTLPRELTLRSLRYFDLRDCLMLEKFPNISPRMESLQTLLLSRTGIKGLPSSIENLTRLEKLDLSYCQSLMDLPDSIYKLQHLSVLEISHCTKLKIDRRLTYHSFGSEYGFLKLEYLNLNDCENLTELDLLKMPDYFPELKYLCLDGTNICMIPESIIRFPRLKRLGIENCKQLQKISRLPQSIRMVCAMNCKSLNSQSLSCILSQAQEILGISPDIICQGARSNVSVDPQSSNRLSLQFVLSSFFFDEFASEAKRSISEDEDIDCKFILPIIDIPKWFNHQSVGNSISFWVGPRFPKFAFCIAFGPEARRGGFVCRVYLKINGCENSISVFSHKEEVCDHLWLFSKSHRELQKQLDISNPSKWNHVEVVCNLYFPDGGESLPTFIRGCGVHVRCTCQLSSSNL